MLMRKHRFHGYNSLRFAYNNSRPVTGRWFSVRVAKNPKRQTYRMAVVVSKKVHKSAVKRNRIRRRFYETIRKEHSIDQPVDIIISIFDESVTEVPQTDLSSELSKLLKKSILYK